MPLSFAVFAKHNTIRQIYTTVPNARPTNAVAIIAADPQNTTRAAPRHNDAPPSHAARAPSPTSIRIVDAPITIDNFVNGTHTASNNGNAAPTANAMAEDNAA